VYERHNITLFANTILLILLHDFQVPGEVLMMHTMY